MASYHPHHHQVTSSSIPHSFEDTSVHWRTSAGSAITHAQHNQPFRPPPPPRWQRVLLPLFVSYLHCHWSTPIDILILSWRTNTKYTISGPYNWPSSSSSSPSNRSNEAKHLISIVHHPYIGSTTLWLRAFETLPLYNRTIVRWRDQASRIVFFFLIVFFSYTTTYHMPSIRFRNCLFTIS